MKFRLTPVVAAVGAVVTLTLAGCGGGSDDSDGPIPPDPAPTTKTLTGTVVIDQGVKNAVVCMDLNADSVCDASEPASAPTADNGAYSMTYDTAAVSEAQVEAASLIARMVPGAATDATTTIDAANPAAALTATAFVLRQVPGKAGQINPLTTLVAAGIASGMTEAVARSNAAVQLGIAEAKIDNYQDDAASTPNIADTARMLAKVTAAALEQGSVLQVADQSAATAASSGSLAQLRYTDSGTYYVRRYAVPAKVAGSLNNTAIDDRSGKGKGVPYRPDEVFNFAYLTADGWARCTTPPQLVSTLGNPSRSTYCGEYQQISFVTDTSDIANQAMSTVVSELQVNAVNPINNGLAIGNLLADLGSAVFPANSTYVTRSSFALSQAILINNLNTDGVRQTLATTLDELVTALPASGVTLATASGSLSLGLATTNTNNLRFAFTGTTSPTAGTVQFYQCELNAAQTVASDCVATQTGTYAIETKNGVRLMRFAGHAETVMNHTRLYVEVQNAPSVVGSGSNWVYQAREGKAAIDQTQSTSVRLNDVATEALLTKLGI